MIESTAFGEMVIDGRTYRSDLFIYPDGRVADGWRRKSGHDLVMDDLAELIASKPELIVCGTGVNGRMRPDNSLPAALKTMGIIFISAKNDEAASIYNGHIRAGRVGACFHLTC
jgi:hypothetical protein